MVYSAEMVTRLQKLRSRVFAEFGVKIRLADPALLDELAQLGPRSRDRFTRSTIEELMALAGRVYSAEPAATNQSGQSTELIYRGNKISRTNAEDTPAPPPERRATKQMYRGQVVYK